MKLLILDDEEMYAELLQISFKSHVIDYEPNPVFWLDKIFLEKTNLNEYDFIFCDYYFDNINMNSFELNMSKYIRKHGFENNLILFSNLSSLEEEKLKDQYFDLVLDKMEFSLEGENADLASVFKEKCKNSPFRAIWQ